MATSALKARGAVEVGGGYRSYRDSVPVWGTFGGQPVCWGKNTGFGHLDSTNLNLSQYFGKTNNLQSTITLLIFQGYSPRQDNHHCREFAAQSNHEKWQTL